MKLSTSFHKRITLNVYIPILLTCLQWVKDTKKINAVVFHLLKQMLETNLEDRLHFSSMEGGDKS
jgi:hypothetical protein